MLRTLSKPSTAGMTNKSVSPYVLHSRIPAPRTEDPVQNLARVEGEGLIYLFEALDLRSQGVAIVTLFETA